MLNIFGNDGKIWSWKYYFFRGKAKLSFPLVIKGVTGLRSWFCVEAEKIESAHFVSEMFLWNYQLILISFFSYVFKKSCIWNTLVLNKTFQNGFYRCFWTLTGLRRWFCVAAIKKWERPFRKLNIHGSSLALGFTWLMELLD